MLPQWFLFPTLEHRTRAVHGMAETGLWHMQGEVRHLKEQLALQEESRSPSIAGTDMNMSSMHPEGVSLFDTLVSSIHNNVAERINLQKALFEVQDADVRTRMQLEALQETLKVCSLNDTLLLSPTA